MFLKLEGVAPATPRAEENYSPREFAAAETAALRIMPANHRLRLI